MHTLCSCSQTFEDLKLTIWSPSLRLPSPLPLLSVCNSANSLQHDSRTFPAIYELFQWKLHTFTYYRFTDRVIGRKFEFSDWTNNAPLTLNKIWSKSPLILWTILILPLTRLSDKLVSAVNFRRRRTDISVHVIKC